MTMQFVYLTKKTMTTTIAQTTSSDTITGVTTVISVSTNKTHVNIIVLNTRFSPNSITVTLRQIPRTVRVV